MCSLLKSGIYSCLCCETVLFDASEKFESHTGWPSFTQPIKENVIAYRFDGPAFLKRVETICSTCDAHLGHVFPDGPAPERSALLRECRGAAQIRRGTYGCRCVEPIAIRPALLHTKRLDRNRVPCFSLCQNCVRTSSTPRAEVAF